MRYLLPKPLPDELIGSVWTRAVRHTGLSIGVVTVSVTGCRSFSPNLFTSACLSDLGRLWMMSAEDLLVNHTVFPAATAFLASPVYERARENALCIGNTRGRTGAVTQCIADAVEFRRYCSACAKEDRREYGESYWRRSHHLPGALVCHIHRCFLRRTDIPTVSRTWSVALPHELNSPVAAGGKPTTFDGALADFAVSRLTSPRNTEGLNRNEYYRGQLIAKGAVDPTRPISRERLAQWLASKFPRPPTTYGFRRSDLHFLWAARMVQPSAKTEFSPLKHAVLSTAVELEAHSESPHLYYKSEGPPTKAKGPADASYARAVDAVVRDYVRRGERVRVSDALQLAGCWSSFRHERASYPKTAAAVARLRASAAACRPYHGQGGLLGQARLEKELADVVKSQDGW